MMTIVHLVDTLCCCCLFFFEFFLTSKRLSFTFKIHFVFDFFIYFWSGEDRKEESGCEKGNHEFCCVSEIIQHDDRGR